MKKNQMSNLPNPETPKNACVTSLEQLSDVLPNTMAFQGVDLLP